MLRIDRTGTLQYKQTERVRYKARMVASVKRGVRRLERAGAQEKHGCRKLSAEAENALPPCLVGDSERNSVSGRLSKTLDRGRERCTPWFRRKLVLL